MESRSRSIRLRIYFLVAIPLIAMVGLLAYVTGTLVNNAVNLDRAPNLINATSLPTAQFVNFLQSERTAAVVYLFQPTAASLAAYNAATAATDQHEKAFAAAMTSPATVSSEMPGEAQGISAVVGGLSKLGTLRGGVRARVLTPLNALGLYSQGIAAEPRLFLAEANSLTDAPAVSQALGLIATVQAREELSQEDALLAGMLAGNRMTRLDQVAFNRAAAARQASLQTAQSVLNAGNLAAYNAQQAGSAAAAQNLASIEQAIAGGARVSHLPATAAAWPQTADPLLRDYYNGGVAVAAAQLVADHQVTRSAWTKVGVISGLALLGLLLTILMTTLVARGIIRRLRGLERSAQTLAEKQLPDVIARLRRGEDVDVASEAPPLQVGRDEIGRVGQAFELVRETAVRSAVEEAKLRQGLNDVFRSLSRRSQSLLHRQLALLDQMERRASDPEALDDLFRLDHLTTRMRRHAEGLVILAGAPSGRGWSTPVRMVDVMRGAIAEVEDYARVTVATRSQAALAGSAVTDVIHLLAELIENATTLSPPYTSVRVSGDTVANGFAIEVEDRGLGMSPQRLAELNDRLASPPEFNPSDSEQLGLFVVGQLAKRHGIRVTLKASPYGGTTAVVLIARNLVVAQDALQAGWPGAPAAIAVANVLTNGHHAATAELSGPASTPITGLTEPRGLPGPPPAPGIRISGPLRRSQGIAGPDELPRRHGSSGAASGAGAAPFADAGSQPSGSAQPAAFDVFMPRQHDADAAPFPGEPAPFPGWTARPPVPGAAPAEPAAPRRPPGPATTMRPAASEPLGQASAPPWELTRESGLPVTPDEAAPGSHADEPGTDDDLKGLPRRIRQASLAPQLRDNPPQRRVTVASSGPTPAEIRRTMSALQRGWQEGRTEPAPGPSSGQPPWGPSAGAGLSAGEAPPAAASPPPDANQAASPPPDTSAPPDTRPPAGPGGSADTGGEGQDSIADQDARRGTDGT